MDSDMLILASVLISEFGRKSEKENEIELWACHFLHLAEYKGKRTQIRFVLKCPSWHSKGLHPMDRLML